MRYFKQARDLVKEILELLEQPEMLLLLPSLKNILSVYEAILSATPITVSTRQILRAAVAKIEQFIQSNHRSANHQLSKIVFSICLTMMMKEPASLSLEDALKPLIKNNFFRHTPGQRKNHLCTLSQDEDFISLFLKSEKSDRIYLVQFIERSVHYDKRLLAELCETRLGQWLTSHQENGIAIAQHPVQRNPNPAHEEQKGPENLPPPQRRIEDPRPPIQRNRPAEAQPGVIFRIRREGLGRLVVENVGRFHYTPPAPEAQRPADLPDNNVTIRMNAMIHREQKQENKQALDDYCKNHQCPLTGTLLRDPVALRMDNNTVQYFERSAIEKYKYATIQAAQEKARRRNRPEPKPQDVPILHPLTRRELDRDEPLDAPKLKAELEDKIYIRILLHETKTYIETHMFPASRTAALFSMRAIEITLLTDPPQKKIVPTNVAKIYRTITSIEADADTPRKQLAKIQAIAGEALNDESEKPQTKEFYQKLRDIKELTNDGPFSPSVLDNNAQPPQPPQPDEICSIC